MNLVYRHSDTTDATSLEIPKLQISPIDSEKYLCFVNRSRKKICQFHLSVSEENHEDRPSVTGGNHEFRPLVAENIANFFHQMQNKITNFIHQAQKKIANLTNRSRKKNRIIIHLCFVIL